MAFKGMEKIVLEGQSLLDVALETGGLESVFELSERNGLSVTDMPTVGHYLVTGDVMSEAAAYFEKNRIRVVTGMDGCDGIWDESFDLTFLR